MHFDFSLFLSVKEFQMYLKNLFLHLSCEEFKVLYMNSRC